MYTYLQYDVSQPFDNESVAILYRDVNNNESVAILYWHVNDTKSVARVIKAIMTRIKATQEAYRNRENKL